ncbi:O-antigen ligase [Mesonia sp. K7]|uniref:O-antigen ligase family protein n=1 Tax=Mesonia sp. K7 TaxID=2218606 RepID=UPI000DAAA4EF|nr:O-antigen ligase family protein [Mesonia sp. K7]PZD79108.1 hypothetical protein DNG35_03625 [Mesonia sp. K7]
MNALKSFFSKENIYDIIASVLVLMLPLSKALPNLLLIPLGVVFLFRLKRNDYSYIKSKTILLYFASIAVLTLFSFLKGTFIDDIAYFGRMYIVLLFFLFFTQVKKVKYIELAFLLGVIIAVGISIINIFVEYQSNPEFVLANNATVNEVLLLERPYFGIVLALGTFIALKYTETRKSNLEGYILAVVFTAFAVYISARLGILMCLLLIVIYTIRLSKRNKNTTLGIGIGLTLLIALAFGLSNNLQKRMFIDNDFERTKKMVVDTEPRFVIWPCIFEKMAHPTIIAFGHKNKQEIEDELVKCYDKTIDYNESKRVYYLKAKFNTHNQFLDFAMLGGYLPAILLLLAFLVSFFSRKISFELKVILTLFFMFFIVENVLQRQLGAFLFGIFVALYITLKQTKKPIV